MITDADRAVALVIDLPQLTNGGLLVPLLIAAVLFLRLRLTTEDTTTKGDQ